MKTLVVRRGIFLSLGIVGLLLFIFIFAVNDPNDSSDILSDSSRRLPKSQNPSQTGDLENVQMDRPDVQADETSQEKEQLNGLESQLGALHENVEEFSNLNRDDTQGWCYFSHCYNFKQFNVKRTSIFLSWPSFLLEINLTLEKSFWVYWRNWLLRSASWNNLEKNPNPKKNWVSKLILQRGHQARIPSHLKNFSNKSLLKNRRSQRTEKPKKLILMMLRKDQGKNYGNDMGIIEVNFELRFLISYYS